MRDPAEQPIDILSQFARVTDYWSPKVVAQVNDQYLKVTKLFWVVRGRLCLELWRWDWPVVPRVRATPNRVA